MSRSSAAVAKLRVRSALNPMLWLCGIFSLPCVVLATVFPNSPLALPLMALGSVPIVGTVVGFLWFMVKAPEKLQSEDYQIRHEALQLIRQKGSKFLIAPSSLEAIANPASDDVQDGKSK
ncbi:MAG: hypothetical protein KBA31_07405 [Alphaproteobacteria bacterium]|nr:hypothetical protein [Alphaproteobacteria bacterium]